MPWSSWLEGSEAAMSKNTGHRGVPTLDECWALIKAHGMLPHIQEHSRRVAEVAFWLGAHLVEAGEPLSLDLIEAAALLHDLGKTPCLGTSRNHATWGANLLRAAGYPEVARIVEEHIALSFDPGDFSFIREAEVVNYADKRVLHTQVVPLAVRFADLLTRYGKTAEARERIMALEAKARVLEAKLFAPLKLDPEVLLHLNPPKYPGSPGITTKRPGSLWQES
jgi:uncharacterized protein